MSDALSIAQAGVAAIEDARSKAGAAFRLLVEMNDELEAENARLREAQGWQPIETAPRDGTEILGFWQYVYPDDEARTFGYSVIQWIALRGCWVDEAGDTTDLFTHWMPLPEAPKEADK